MCVEAIITTSVRYRSDDDLFQNKLWVNTHTRQMVRVMVRTAWDSFREDDTVIQKLSAVTFPVIILLNHQT